LGSSPDSGFQFAHLRWDYSNEYLEVPMKRILSTLFVLSSAAAMTFSAAAQVDNQSANTATTSAKQSAGMGDIDSTFVKKAARGGLAEIEFGQLATQKLRVKR
jgi:hypothetical protein